MTSQAEAYEQLSGGRQGEQQSTKAFLEEWADEVWAMPATHEYLNGKGKWSDWFNGGGGKLVDNDRMNGMEGLADKFHDVQQEVSAKGAEDAEALQKLMIEKAKEQINAAAQFMMAVSFVSALLVTVQLSLVCAAAEVHPMMLAFLNKVDEWLHIATVWYYDTAYYSKDGSVSLEEAVEVHYSLYVVQHFAAIYLMFSVKDNLLLVIRACKGYGHLMYWCPDLETKLWYARSSKAQWVQHRIRNLGNGFLMSLFPYLLILHGPLVAAACVLMAWRLKREFEDFNVDACVQIALHVTAKVRGGFKDFEKPL